MSNKNEQNTVSVNHYTAVISSDVCATATPLCHVTHPATPVLALPPLLVVSNEREGEKGGTL